MVSFVEINYFEMFFKKNLEQGNSITYKEEKGYQRRKIEYVV